MAEIATIYGNFYVEALTGKVNLLTDTAKCMICTNAYVPDVEAHKYLSDVAHEITGAGYAQVILASKTLVYDAVAKKVKFDALDMDINNVTMIGARYVVVYIDSGDPLTSILIGYVDLGADRDIDDGTFKLIWDAQGILS